MTFAKPQNFSVRSGVDDDVEVLFTDENGDAIDLTGSVIRWGAQAANAGSDVEDALSKTTVDGSITVLDQTQPSTKGRARLVFVPSDTASLDGQTFDHQAAVIDTRGKTREGYFGTMSVRTNV